MQEVCSASRLASLVRLGPGEDRSRVSDPHSLLSGSRSATSSRIWGGRGKKVNKKNFLRDFQQLFHKNYDKMFHFFNPCVCPSSSVLTSGPVSDLLKLFTFWIRIRMVTLKSSCAFVAEVDRFGRIRVILLD